jgi:serine/threonine protein phosphatase PrpC
LETLPEDVPAAPDVESTLQDDPLSESRGETPVSVERPQLLEDELNPVESEAAVAVEYTETGTQAAEEIPQDHPIALLGPPVLGNGGETPIGEERENPDLPDPPQVTGNVDIEHSEVGEAETQNDSNTTSEGAKVQSAVESVALEPGTRLADRYEILALVDETENTLVYNALDYGRCSQCGYADSQLDDIFCAHCGASLEAPRDIPHIRLCALRLEGEAVIQLEDETEGRVERWFEWDDRLYALLPPAEDEPAETATLESRGVRHIVGYSSDPGLQRELDEDAVLAITLTPTFESRSSPSLGLYAVADGMGGHESGEIASRLAIEELAATILKRLFLPELAGEPVLPETPVDLFRESVQSINARIFELQRTTGSDMGTTLTAALVRDETALIANVGDSRTYLWRDGELVQITSDHSLVAQLVEAGALEPDEIYTHPEKSAIYRSLGHAPEVEVDLFEQPLESGDRLVLCCDGVWEMLRSDGIEEVLLMEPDPQCACEEMVRRANLAGGEDNISVAVVQFEQIVANR